MRQKWKALLLALVIMLVSVTLMPQTFMFFIAGWQIGTWSARLALWIDP